MNDAEFKAFIDNNIKHHFIENRILQKVRKALKEAGTPIVTVYDGEESEGVGTLRSLQEQVFNLDECYLMTEDGSYVRFTLGNEWDVISDYTIDLEDALKPVNDWIDQNS